jgi:hypothetical protein
MEIPMGRRPSLAKLPIEVIRSEVRQRESAVERLKRRRRTVLLKADRLAEQLRALGEEPVTPERYWPKNSAPLVDMLAKVLDGQTLRVVDAVEAVKQAGYWTRSNHFRTQVNLALSKSGKFKRVGHGQYTTK